MGVATRERPEKPGLPWLFRGFVGDEILPSYFGIVITYYEDPYETNSTMECKRLFLVAQVDLFVGCSDVVVVYIRVDGVGLQTSLQH